MAKRAVQAFPSMRQQAAHSRQVRGSMGRDAVSLDGGDRLRTIEVRKSRCLGPAIRLLPMSPVRFVTYVLGLDREQNRLRKSRLARAIGLTLSQPVQMGHRDSGQADVIPLAV